MADARQLLLLDTFRPVARERLQRLERRWLELEGGTNADAVAELKRDLHTFKAEARVVGLEKSSGLLHLLEDVAAEVVARGASAPRPARDAFWRSLEALAQAVEGDESFVARVTAEVADWAHELGAKSSVVPEVVPASEAASDAPRAVDARAVRRAAQRLDDLSALCGDLWASQARAAWHAAALEQTLHAAVTEAQATHGGQSLSEETRARLRACVRDMSRLHDHLLDQSRLVRKVDEEVRQLELVEAGPLLTRLGRFVRDQSETAHRSVRLELFGHGVYADRGVIDALGEPLLHLLQNALDHGLEGKDERVRLGKPPEGKLSLGLALANGRLLATVEDDGRGIDVEALASRAQAMGVSSAPSLDLAFVPGLSTRGEAGMTSGRGVGMDAVRYRVEQLGGAVSLESSRGVGTKVLLSVPAVSSLLRCVLTRIGGTVYALPSAAVREVKSTVDEAPGRLWGLLGLPAPETAAPRVVLTVSAGGRTRNLASVRPEGERELHVVPVAGPASRSNLLAGAALLESGETALVLDPAELLSLETSGVAG
jgi:two-component system chemotaxis sensor kinase CheA